MREGMWKGSIEPACLVAPFHIGPCFNTPIGLGLYGLVVKVVKVVVVVGLTQMPL